MASVDRGRCGVEGRVGVAHATGDWVFLAAVLKRYLGMEWLGHMLDVCGTL